MLSFYWGLFLTILGRKLLVESFALFNGKFDSLVFTGFNSTISVFPGFNGVVLYIFMEETLVKGGLAGRFLVSISSFNKSLNLAVEVGSIWPVVLSETFASF